VLVEKGSNDTNLEFTKVEAKAIDGYIEDIYSKKVPAPTAPSKKELSFWNIAGIEAVLFTIAGIGIAIYSAIRTGGLFYIMEVLLLEKFSLSPAITEVLSLSAMISSLAAFELYVIADGFVKGRNNENLKRSAIGLWSSLGIIVISGLFTGLGLISNLDPNFELYFYIIIAISTAFAGGLVALYSGENIGFTFAKVDRVRKELVEKHRDDFQLWRESGIKSYNSSHYALGTKKSSEFVRNLNKVTRKSNKAPIYKKKILEKKAPIQEEKSEYKKIGLGKNFSKNFVSTYDNVMSFVEKNNRLPKVAELETLGSDKTQTYLAYSQFIMQNEAHLLETNLISNDSIEKVKKYLDTNMSKVE
jgi:hypothetical protein